MGRSNAPVKRSEEISFEVKFLEDCDPEDGSALFKAGNVYELVASSAYRWIRRGKAERYVPKPKKRGRPPKTPPAPKPSAVVFDEEKKMPIGDFSVEESTVDSESMDEPTPMG